MEVSGEALRWPGECACCFEPADASLRIDHTTAGGFLAMFEETRGWDVPYCSTCLRHLEMAQQAPSATGALGAAAAGGLVGGPIGLLMGLGAAAASVVGAAH